MKRSDMAWQRLVKAARQVPATDDVAAPYGFATRTAAQAFTQGRPAASLIEQFALRALGVASLLAVLGVVSNYSVIAQASTAHVADSFSAVTDPAAIVLGETVYE